MDLSKYTPALQNELRQHEEHEREIINSAKQTIRAISQYEHGLHPIDSVGDVIEMLTRISERDKHFQYVAAPDTVIGAALRKIQEEIEIWMNVRHELVSRADYEASALQANQETQDKVIFYLNSIDQRVKNIETQGSGTEAAAAVEEWRQHLINKVFAYPPDGKRVINSLNNTVAELVKYSKQNVTSKFIKENFFKRDGSEYSDDAANAARDYANTK